MKYAERLKILFWLFSLVSFVIVLVNSQLREFIFLETCVGWPNEQASFLTSTPKSQINPIQGRHFLYFIG